MTQTPKDIHDAYCLASGNSPNYRVHERAYAEFIAYGFTAEDVTMVVQYIKAENKRMNGASFSLRPDSLFDFEFRKFDGLLSVARGWWRNRKPAQTPRGKIVSIFEQVQTPQNDGKLDAVTVREALRRVIG